MREGLLHWALTRIARRSKLVVTWPGGSKTRYGEGLIFPALG